MINEQILQSIQCAIPHKCVAESNKCAQCDIGYCFISCEPTTLQCGHQICSECKVKCRKRKLKCKICAIEMKSLDVISLPAEVWIQYTINDLTVELKEKYAKALKIYHSNKNEEYFF